VHPIFAQLEANPPTGVSDFLHKLAEALKSFAKQAIDTPAERLAIVESVGKFFDSYVAKYLPLPMVKPFREALVGMIDSTLEALSHI
jgi:hypothetical protein